MIMLADSDDTIDKYVLYFGKSDVQKIGKRKNVSAYIADTSTTDSSYYIPENTKVPDHATHLLLYSKNEHGEHPTPASVKIVDNLKPCQRLGRDDCPSGLVVTKSPDGPTLTVERAKDESGIVAYVLYWGLRSCEEGSSST